MLWNNEGYKKKKKKEDLGSDGEEDPIVECIRRKEIRTKVMVGRQCFISMEPSPR